MKLPLAVLLSCFASSTAFSLNVDVDDQRASRILRPAFAALSANLSALFPQGIKVRFVDLGPLPSALGCAAPSATHGLVGQVSLFSFRTPEIKINRRLIYQKIEFCRFGSRDRYILSVALHEFAHLIDSRLGVTKTARFQGIAKGFHATHFRSPDSYEDVSPAENFAVNFEHAMLDPNYTCRRPFMARFLREATLGSVPLTAGCDPNYNVFLNLTGSPVSIDPKRIYQIQYLVAGPGASLISKFGHSFFRVVICAPQRPFPSPDCLEDVDDHLVASFQALVTDKNFDLSKGLVGTYYQNVNFYRWSEIKTEYGFDEARTLDSFPLELSNSARQDFVDRLVEKYWSRFDRYSFTVNNCSHETMRQLQDILPSDHPLQSEIGATPIGLLAAFDRAGLIQRNLHDDPSTKSEMAYYAGRDQVAEAERRISNFLFANNLIGTKTLTAAEYNNLSQESRESVLLRLSTSRDTSLIFAFSVLEQRRFNELSRKAIGEGLEKHREDPEVKRLYETVKALNTSIILQRSGESGYGVPPPFESQSSRAKTLQRLIETRDSELVRLYANLATKHPSPLVDDKYLIALAGLLLRISEGK